MKSPLNEPKYNSFKYRWNLFLCAIFGHKPGIDGAVWEVLTFLVPGSRYHVGYCPRCRAYESPQAVLTRCHLMEKYGAKAEDS